MKNVTLCISVLVLAMALFVPNWKSDLFANTYKNVKYLVTNATVVEKTAIKGCSKHTDSLTGDVVMYDDNSFEINTSSATLSGSWYRIGNKVTLTLDGGIDMANGNTGSYATLFSYVNNINMNSCSVASLVRFVEPTAKIKMYAVLNEKNNTAKLTTSVKGYSLNDVSGQQVLSKTSHKSVIVGSLSVL